MNDYKPNSHKFREEEKRKAEKVVKTEVKTKKKGEIGKLADVFIAEDVKNVKSYILMDVLVPTIKKAIVDVVTDAVNMIFLGGTNRGARSSSGVSKVSYKSYYDQGNSRPTDTKMRSRFDFDELVFGNRGEAEAVRTRMDEMIETYGMVTVGDMYDMAGLTQPYTSENYGWTSIRTAEIVRVRDGYVIKLPRCMPLDQR